MNYTDDICFNTHYVVVVVSANLLLIPNDIRIVYSQYFIFCLFVNVFLMNPCEELNVLLSKCIHWKFVACVGVLKKEYLLLNQVKWERCVTSVCPRLFERCGGLFSR